ncbi:Armadillo-like helical [Artemisia annua]|uniref:Armadillo-like helical n=1 Tax=Artemisia annua TaxID=35608 RepID=A0A2U1QNM8_ARTAN|nr:Armadillo-like helical [Artemisia annua]
MFFSQNPSQNPSYDHYFAPSSAGSSIQQPQLNTYMGSSSSSVRSFDVGNNGGYVFDKEKQVFTGMGLNPNPVRSILDYGDHRYHQGLSPYNGFCCNTCHQDPMYGVSGYHPGVAGFDHRSGMNNGMNGFMENPNIDRSLEFDFSRLALSSPSHMAVPLPGPAIRNNALINNSYMNNNIYPQGRVSPQLPVNRSARVHDMWNSYDLNQRSFSNVLDQTRDRFMKCEEGKAEDIEIIFNGIKDHIREVMVDSSMNYLGQKLFKVCNEKQMTDIVLSIASDDGAGLSSICLNSHGTRAMQKLIELLTTTDQRTLIVSALKRITVPLTKNTNGHHVIQHCLKSFKVDEVQPIMKVVADNCLDIAMDKSGCCVLQQCVLHADGVSRDRLMAEIIANALPLSEHPYGNYVVQHIVGMQIPEVTGEIVRKLSGNLVHLATNKFASNVVEKCLKDGPDDECLPIIRELINSPNFLSVVQNAFGNYVVQSALQAAKGSLKEAMISKIQKEYPFLHSHPHGKRVLALARNSKPRGSCSHA